MATAFVMAYGLMLIMLTIGVNGQSNVSFITGTKGDASQIINSPVGVMYSATLSSTMSTSITGSLFFASAADGNGITVIATFTSLASDKNLYSESFT